MKKYLILCLGIVLSSLMFYSCGPDDYKLKAEAEEVLIESAPRVQVSVNRGIVTLEGTVETEEIKNSVGEKIQAIEGVKSVVNEVNVVVSKPIMSKADEDLYKTIEVMLKAGNYNNVTIEVKDKEVTFNGTVPTEKDVKRISLISQQIEIAKLTNNVTAEGK